MLKEKEVSKSRINKGLGFMSFWIYFNLFINQILDILFI